MCDFQCRFEQQQTDFHTKNVCFNQWHFIGKMGLNWNNGET